MARLIYSRKAFADLDRLVDFLLETASVAAVETAELISEAVQILGNHPFVGRPAEHDMRDLTVSRGRTGYLVLYSYEEAYDVVLVLAVRHQREAGYDAD